ncbi:ATP-binding protein [Thalassolituus sp. LLYu03]|uniref:ATP-binding protein n=1 Tax=Thalassolituus sp. LLYu03 TaxID=3421656 RepID=UPI003D2C0480
MQNLPESRSSSPEKAERFPFRIQYPWRSLLGLILLLFYAALLASPELLNALPVPAPFVNAVVNSLLNTQMFSAASVLLLLLCWADVRRFFRQQRKVRESMQTLWENKRQLQQRAQTSASHTDKLKLFISDKLLEYIEYDEKFLHFKSIASEVRHNGVISFDKVQSALHFAREHSLPGERGDTALMYQDALSAMRYLWDLLDLSTTDNMALHIGAQVSRCEEQAFQAELQGTEVSALPASPVFEPAKALLDTLTLHLGVTLCSDDGEENPALLFRTDQPEHLQLRDKDGIFRLDIQPCAVLPGNANHLILLLENLLRNAQYFATRKTHKGPLAPVSVRLWEAQQCLCLTVYNRGPHINADDKEQIFQLGFSTRKVREHHGKGLGLYFVQQITQGFDGDIGCDNITNHSGQYHLRLELDNGDVQNLHLEVALDDGRPQVRLSGSDADFARQWEMPLSRKLMSLEVNLAGDSHVSRFALNKSERLLVDNRQLPGPHWQAELTGRKGDVLRFTPLDIRGVQFSLRLPTLEGRMDGVSATNLWAPDVDQLDASFRSPDDF